MDARRAKDLARVASACRRGWWLALLLIGVFLPGGISMLWLGIAERDVAIGALGVGSAAAGSALLVWARRRRDPRSHPVFRLLAERPEDVVWIYRRVVLGYGGREESVHVHRTDGRIHVLQGSTRGEELEAAVARLAPQAICRYDEELERQYRKDPRSLGPAPADA
jgi:hypothetical protein